MAALVLRRVALALVVVWAVLTATFFAVQLAPGHPAVLYQNPRIPPAQQAELAHALGLDRSPVAQYGAWLAAMVRGDWGTSFTHGRPVRAILAESLPDTLRLSLAALAVGLVAGIGAGVAAARRRGSPADYSIRIGSLLAYSLPHFWVGLMVIYLFSYRLGWLPSGGTREAGTALQGWPYLAEYARHLVLPTLALGAPIAGGVARFLRNALLDSLHTDYVRTARAGGISETRIFWVHALKNSLTPIVQLFGLSLPMLFSGALVTEVVFSWPGMGRIAYSAILERDYPLILGATALTAVLVVAGNLLADVLQGVLDPRTLEAD